MNKPEIVKTILREGVELKQRGNLFLAKCCFHEEKTASLTVYQEKQRFECFGCGKHGDVIDFVRFKHNMSFLEAKRYLLMGDNPKPIGRVGVDKQDLLRRFRKWEKKYFTSLAKEYKMLLYQIENVKQEYEWEFKSVLVNYHRLPVVEYLLDVMIEGTDKDKLELYRRIK